MTIPQRFFNTCLAVFLAGTTTFVLAQPSLDFVTGRALFEKQWVFAPASTQASDGLGPYFNARSCNACHAGGGRGDVESTLTLHINDLVYGEQLQKFTRPGIPAEAVFTINWSDPKITGSLRTAAVTIMNLTYGPLANPAVSLRLAPALMGLGQLEAIPDSVLVALADPGDSDGDGISGRVNRLRDKRIGRFGWKASQPDLRDQVGRALSLDLGLGNPVLPSPHGDCTSSQAACLETPHGGVNGLEVNEQVIDLILSYVRGLPAPARVSFKSQESERGAAVFSRLGCDNCHKSSIGGVAAYTDLLLHDMGPGLADNLEEGSAAGSEWRTPPLWGLDRASGAFLHDGRARNLREAILWHDGEGRQARQDYLGLNEAERGDLITFLDGL